MTGCEEWREEGGREGGREEALRECEYMGFSSSATSCGARARAWRAGRRAVVGEEGGREGKREGRRDDVCVSKRDVVPAQFLAADRLGLGERSGGVCEGRERDGRRKGYE